MELQTALTPVMAGQQLQIKNAQGQMRLKYDRLKVWDARGQEMPAVMQLAGRTLTLSVQDQAAQYPLTIDPSWSQTAYLKADNAGEGDEFGQSVALSGDTLAVGALFEDGDGSDPSDNSAPASGAVYVFTRSGSVWSQTAYLKAGNAEAYDCFGYAVALSGNTLAVGAYLEDSADGSNPGDNRAANSGAVYAFSLPSQPGVTPVPGITPVPTLGLWGLALLGLLAAGVGARRVRQKPV